MAVVSEWTLNETYLDEPRLSDGMYDTNGFTGLVDSGITGKRASLTLSSNINHLFEIFIVERVPVWWVYC